MNTAQSIASKLAAIANCRKSGNTEWLAKHSDALADLVKQKLPHGSGVDMGTKIDDRSTPDKLVLLVPFHHMDSNGYYSGWADYTVTVRASLLFGLDIKIAGRDRNGIKDYLHDLFADCLTAEA